MKAQLNFFQLLLCLSLVSFLVSCGSDDSVDPVVVDCTTTTLTISVMSSSDITCSASGAVTVSASGGEGTIEYSIDGSTFQSSASFTDLEKGNYTITARDGNDCTKTTSVAIAVDPEVVTFSSSTTDSGCGTSQGSITITGSGGDSNYQYSFDGGDYGTTNTFSGLAAGSYTVKVKDGASCEETDKVKVLSGVKLGADIRPIINQSCAVTGCHVAGTGRQDLTLVSVIQSNASGIKSRTQSGNMPKAGSLTQEQIDLIACWVDDGALNN